MTNFNIQSSNFKFLFLGAIFCSWFCLGLVADENRHDSGQPSILRTTKQGDDLNELDCSEMGRLIRENGNNIPTSLKDFARYFKEKQGGVKRAIVYATQATNQASLALPRILLSPNERSNRLFLAFNFSKTGERLLEFISWNEKKREYDFGVVENYDKPEKRKIIANVELRNTCIKCHKSEGPHLTISSWPNSVATSGSMEAFVRRQVEVDPEHYKKLWSDILRGNSSFYAARNNKRNSTIMKNAKLYIDKEDSGLPLFSPDDLSFQEDLAEYDFRVRTATSHNLFHQIFKTLSRAEQQHYLSFATRLLSTDLIGSGSRPRILNEGQAIKGSIINKAFDLPLATKSNSLRAMNAFDFQVLDFLSPAGTLAVDARVQNGEKFLFDPISSDKAFAEMDKDQVRNLLLGWFGEKTSDGTDVNPIGTLDQLVGITTQDKEHISDLFSNVPGNLLQGISRAVVNSQNIRDLSLAGNTIPSRKTYMTALTTAIRTELKARNIKVPVTTEYENELVQDNPCGNFSQNESRQPLHIHTDRSSSRCFSCHEGDPGIPKFLFDPASKEEWKKWLTGSDEKKRQYAQRLAPNVIKRINSKDAPMPPEDSPGLTDNEKSALIRSIRTLMRAP